MMQMKKPLDFQAVADHAFYLGMMPALWDETSKYGNHPLAETVRGSGVPGSPAF